MTEIQIDSDVLALRDQIEKLQNERNLWRLSTTGIGSLFIGLVVAAATGYFTYGVDNIKHTEIPMIMEQYSPYNHDKQRIQEHLDLLDREIQDHESRIRGAITVEQHAELWRSLSEVQVKEAADLVKLDASLDKINSKLDSVTESVAELKASLHLPKDPRQ